MNLESVLERTRLKLRRKQLAWRTEEAYCDWIRRFSRFVCKLPKELSSEEKAERFLTCIARKGCSASTQNQVFNAIIFLYKEVLKRPLLNVQAPKAGTAPSRRKVARIVAHLQQQNDYSIKLLAKPIGGKNAYGTCTFTIPCEPSVKTAR